jgi:hypothetical protein
MKHKSNEREERIMRHAIAPIALALLVVGCGSPPSLESPPLGGRLVQGTDFVARGAVPYRVGAYELTFADGPGIDARARRAALLVDMAAGQGHVRGFVEWGKPGQVPMTYVAGGWARQRDVGGEVTTVFELALNSLEVPGARGDRRDAEPFTPLAVRVVVNEASGDVTLTRRR